MGHYFSLFPSSDEGLSNATLCALGANMQAYHSPCRGRVKAGYVYFMQFLMHDITHLSLIETNPGCARLVVDSLENLNQCCVSLDSLYGDGFHDARIPRLKGSGKLALRPVRDVQGLIEGWDLCRYAPCPAWPSGKPMIGNLRNDENYIIAQLHVLFARLHNHFCDQMDGLGLPPPPHLRGLGGERLRYEMARHHLILHYQQVILYDVLRNLLDTRVWDYVIRRDQSLLWPHDPALPIKLPVEYTAAAARFGHAMIRPDYIIGARTLRLSEIFDLTGKGRFKGAGQLEADYLIDWRHFFDADFGKGPVRGARNTARAIDVEVPLILAHDASEPDRMQLMPLRNLLRGNEVGLADAQSIIASIIDRIGAPQARAIGLAPLDLRHELLDKETGNSIFKGLEQADVLLTKTPLWFYVLAEAQLTHQGKRLGPLGSLLSAEVIKNLIKASTPSCLGPPEWQSPWIHGSMDLDGTSYPSLPDLLSLVL